MNFSRYYVPGATVFVTQVVHYRETVFAVPAYVELLRVTLHKVKELHPFRMLGYVFLHDHFHLLFCPSEQSNFSQIMQSFKRNFTLEYKKVIGLSGPMKFWQKRFRDHIIRDDQDFANHLHYIHFNPVHHGLVDKPELWPHSSFLTWKKKDAYPDRWGWTLPDSLSGFDVDE